MSNSDDKRPLGKILLQRKLVSQQQIDTALREQKRAPGETAKPLATQLVASGALDELDALRALSEQQGVPGIDLSQVAILLDHLDVVPREVAEAHRIVPVLMRGDRIFLAMADPNDKRVIDELEFVTGKKVYPYIALQSTLARTIAAAYDAKEAGQRHYLGPNVPVETLRQLGLAPAADAAPAAVVPAAAPPPVAPRPAARPAPPALRPAAPRVQPPVELRAAAPSAPRPATPSTPGIVLDETFAEVAGTTEVSTSEFGVVDADVSSLNALPDDLRAGATAAAAGVATAGAGKLILVVDDEAEIRKMLKRLLTGRGHRVIEADRGLLALRLVKDHVPDLIILDAMLPELHGFDIARRIKGSEKYGRIPIIMVSAVYRGWRIAEDLKQSYGIEEYIEKPFRISDVWEAVNRWLSRDKDAPTESHPELPRDPEALSADAEKALNEGVAAYKAGRLDEAIEHLRRGVGIDPLAYRLHFHLALLFGKKGMVYEGIQELEKAIDLNPKHFAALKNLAVLYEKAGFKHKAVEMWERCAGTAPDDATRAQVKQHLLKLL
jgi:DNA-binding response OmpR family regulator